MTEPLHNLLEQHFDTAFAAPDGIKKLRELILTLAMQGKLVAQDPNDPPASELLKQIEAEKQRLVKSGKIKQPKPLPPIKLEEVPYELPEGWEWVRLPEIYFGIGNKKNQIQSIDYSETGQFPIVDQGRNYIGGFCDDKDRLLNIDRPVVVFGDHTKNIKYVDFDFVIGADGVKILCPYYAVLAKFLYFLVQSLDLTDRGYARHFKVLNEKLALLPPLPEQHRIVTKIDQLMAKCDELEALRKEREEKRRAVHTAAIKQLLDTTSSFSRRRESSSLEELEPRFPSARGQTCGGDGVSAHGWNFIQQHFGELYTVKENVTELRKTILQLAVMGRLVPQDPNDPPASELLKRIEAEKQRLHASSSPRKLGSRSFTSLDPRLRGDDGIKTKSVPPIKPEEVPYELPQGWEWVRVWNIAQLITSGSRDWAKYYAKSGAIFVTMGNLSRDNYQLRMDSIRYVSPPLNGEGSRTKLEENDLLISITGDVGNLGLIPSNFGEAYINQHTCLLRLMPNFRNRYFPELMRSPLAKKQFDAPQRGIKNSFRLNDVGEMIIPLPPLPEQHRIVAKIDQLMALCDRLEQQIDAATGKQTELLNAVMAEV